MLLGGPSRAGPSVAGNRTGQPSHCAQASTLVHRSRRRAVARRVAELTAGGGSPGPEFQDGPSPDAIAFWPVRQGLGPVSDSLLRDWQSGYDSLFYEYDYYVDEALGVEGEIPEDLRGTYIHGGPGLTSIFGHTCRAPADADGLVCSLAFGEKGRAFFRNKFVRTTAFAAEQVAARRLNRGMHDRGLVAGNSGSPLNTWLLNPLDLSFASRANSGVLHWGGKLYALSENALPWEINKVVLDTVGESTMGGLLEDVKTLAGRYKVLPGEDGSASRIVLMQAPQSGLDAMVRFTELDAAGKVVARAQHRVPGVLARMLTDFVVTEHWYCVVAPPVTFNAQRFVASYLVGDASFAECFEFEPHRPSRLHLIPRVANPPPPPSSLPPPRPTTSAEALAMAKAAQRGRGSRPGSPLAHRAAVRGRSPSASPEPPPRAAISLDAPPMVVPAGINGYELDGGRYVVMDMIAHEDLPYWKDMTQLTPGYFNGQPKPEVTRFVVDTQTGVRTVRSLTHRSAEHVAVAPGRVGKPHKHLFAAASAVEDAQHWGPAQVLTKLTVPPQLGIPGFAQSARRRTASSAEVWAPGDRCFVGPPTLVPKAGGTAEDDVWVLAMIHDAESRKAELAILDGSKITAGPVASILLPHHVPFGTGAVWAKEYYGPGRGLAGPDWKPRQPTPSLARRPATEDGPGEGEGLGGALSL